VQCYPKRLSFKGEMIQKGDAFKLTYAVSEKIHEGFIALFNDNNPLHTNTEFAQRKGFSGKVMHGNILGGFLSFFIGTSLPMKNVIIHTQEINYLKPVYLNDELFFTAVVEDVFESVHTIEFKFVFENKKNVKVAKGKIQIGIL
jgi:3-hydroxybutyryl-CoA dehydratase